MLSLTISTPLRDLLRGLDLMPPTGDAGSVGASMDRSRICLLIFLGRFALDLDVARGLVHPLFIVCCIDRFVVHLHVYFFDKDLDVFLPRRLLNFTVLLLPLTPCFLVLPVYLFFLV
jgi:hypothetical protein